MAASYKNLYQELEYLLKEYETALYKGEEIPTYTAYWASSGITGTAPEDKTRKAIVDLMLKLWGSSGTDDDAPELDEKAALRLIGEAKQSLIDKGKDVPGTLTLLSTDKIVKKEDFPAKEEVQRFERERRETKEREEQARREEKDKNDAIVVKIRELKTQAEALQTEYRKPEPEGFGADSTDINGLIALLAALETDIAKDAAAKTRDYDTYKLELPKLKALVDYKKNFKVAVEDSLKSKITTEFASEDKFREVARELGLIKDKMKIPGAYSRLDVEIKGDVTALEVKVDQLVALNQFIKTKTTQLKNEIPGYQIAKETPATEAHFQTAFDKLTANGITIDNVGAKKLELEQVVGNVKAIGELLNAYQARINATKEYLNTLKGNTTEDQRRTIVDFLTQIETLFDTELVAPGKITALLNKGDIAADIERLTRHLTTVTENIEAEKPILEKKAKESEANKLKQRVENYRTKAAFKDSYKKITDEQYSSYFSQKITILLTKFSELAAHPEKLTEIKDSFASLEKEAKDLNDLVQRIEDTKAKVAPGQRTRFDELTKTLRDELAKSNAVDLMKAGTFADTLKPLQIIDKFIALQKVLNDEHFPGLFEVKQDIANGDKSGEPLILERNKLILDFKLPNALTETKLAELEKQLSTLQDKFIERKNPEEKLLREIKELNAAYVDLIEPKGLLKKTNFQLFLDNLEALRKEVVAEKKPKEKIAEFNRKFEEIKSTGEKLKDFLSKAKDVIPTLKEPLSPDQITKFKSDIATLETEANFDTIAAKVNALIKLKEKVTRLVSLQTAVTEHLGKLRADTTLEKETLTRLIGEVETFRTGLAKVEAIDTIGDKETAFAKQAKYIENLIKLTQLKTSITEYQVRLGGEVGKIEPASTRTQFDDLTRQIAQLEEFIKEDLKATDPLAIDGKPGNYETKFNDLRSKVDAKFRDLHIEVDKDAFALVSELNPTIQALQDDVEKIKKGFGLIRTIVTDISAEKAREIETLIGTTSTEIDALAVQNKGPKAKENLKDTKSRVEKVSTRVTELKTKLSEATELIKKKKEEEAEKAKAKVEDKPKEGEGKKEGGKKVEEDGKKKGSVVEAAKGDGLTEVDAAAIHKEYDEKFKKLSALKDSAIKKFKDAGMGKVFHSDKGLFLALERAIKLLQIAPNNKNLQELARIKAAVVYRIGNYIDEISKNEKDKKKYEEGLAALTEFKEASEKFIDNELLKHKGLVPVYQGIKSELIEVKDSEDSTFDAKLAEVMGTKGKDALLEMSDDTIDGRRRYIKDIDATHFMKNQVGDVVWTERLDKQKVIRSQAFELPDKLQPEKIWADMYKFVKAAGLSTKISEEEFKDIFKHLRDSNQPIDKDHILPQFERYGIKNEGVFTRNISDLAGKLRDHYHETYDANLSQKIKGAIYPSDLVINTMKCFIDSMLAKDPKAEIVLNKMPSAQFAIAAFLYVEVLNRDPARKEKIQIFDQSGFQISRGDILSQKGFSLQTFNNLLYRDTIGGKSLEESRLETRATNYVRSTPRASGGGS